MTLYALDARRAYPYRSGCYDPNNYYLPHLLKESSLYNGADDRPELVGYVTLDSLLDPLAGQIDLSPEGVNPETRLIMPRDIWWGFRYLNFGGMVRVGDSIRSRGERFTTLINDLESAWTGNIEGAHPDHDGKLRLIFVENGNGVAGGFTQTVSTWWSDPTRPTERGLIDRNVGRADGSVQRYAGLDVPPVYSPLEPGDYPMRPLPVTSNAAPETVGDHWVPPN